MLQLSTTDITVSPKAGKLLLPHFLNLGTEVQYRLQTIETREEEEEEMPYHKIDAVLGIMPRRFRLDDDEGYVDRIPLVVGVMGEALLPVDHEADSRGIVQERHEADD